MKQDPKYSQHLREQILKLVHQVSRPHSDVLILTLSLFARLEMVTTRSRTAFCSER